jgi:hypothetical protein
MQARFWLHFKETSSVETTATDGKWRCDLNVYAGFVEESDPLKAEQL